MHEVRAPEYAPRADVFLAGGIMNAPDWQAEAVELLAPHAGSFYNPRRSEPFTRAFQEAQIKWEYEALNAADSILFWFPHETLCPITLFELGARSRVPDQPIFVGAHPDYARNIDIHIQLGLARPDVRVCDSLEETVAQFLAWHLRRVDV